MFISYSPQNNQLSRIFMAIVFLANCSTFDPKLHTTLLKRVLPSILFLLVLMAPFAATTWFFKSQQKIIRKQVKRALVHSVDQSELVELRFSKTQLETELEWKHSKEFRYKGEMYDIVSREESADSTVFFCWWDHAETKLYKQLDQLLAAALGSNPHRKKQSELVVQFYKSLFFNTLNYNTSLPFITNSTTLLQPESLNSRFLENPTPPPQSV